MLMSIDDFAVIQQADVPGWTDETDVLVVGFGAAGSCASIGARSNGVDVLVLERASGVSGTTCQAAGHFYLGGGTRPQLANGIDDSTEEMFKYLMANTPEPEVEKIRLYADQSVDHFNWLTDQGVPFNDGFWKTKHVEQPTDECLIWSGNEKAWPVSEQAKPAPRGHKVAMAGSGVGGNLAMENFLATAVDVGVRFKYDAAVKNLVLGENGRVVGVRYSSFGEDCYVKAGKAVILAAGGFCMNSEMLEQYCPKLTHDSIHKMGNPYDDGAGIQLGMSAGAEAKHMDGCLVTSPFYPPEDLIKGILINKEGKRFINEDCYHARTSDACIDQPEGVAYLILDNEIFGRPEFQSQQLIDGWQTIEEMEEALELPSGSLVATVNAYNGAAAEGEDPEFHKYKDWLKPLTDGPFAAFDCSLANAVFTGFTLGGLSTDTNAQVLSGSGAVINGLYAAGACASNIAQDGAGYSSGTCIGESTFFGRRAGRHAAGDSAL